MVAGLATALTLGQPPTPAPRPSVTQVKPGVFQLGSIRVDTAQRELSVPAKVTDAQVLEFVACTRGGFKEYESALEIDTDAISFNAAMLLLGVDPAHARVPVRHFDPIPPKGDPVEVTVSWDTPLGTKRIRVEELLLDRRTGKSIPEGPWVYTGSTFVEQGKYLADIDGVLIGFVHSPAPVIENPRAGAVDAYGDIVRNPMTGALGGMQVTLTVKALAIDHP
ncbi:MAG TPA: YdjY domain-containing protein [Vicinamibacterales bacterium]|nr:YdjY domain-containing protein [Vicinamibacterales bacterium]